MVGTAFRHQPFGMIASPGRPRLRAGLVVTPFSALQRDICGAVSTATALTTRQVLTAFLVLAFIFGTIVSSPATHEWLEGEPAASIQALGDAAKAPADHKAPLKKDRAGLCTGHCVAHTLTLPAFFAQAIVPIALRAVWSVFEDPWLQVSRPVLLERPPRF